MKQAVLCVSRTALVPQFNPLESGIHPFNISSVSDEAFHYVNRALCDAKDEETVQSIAKHIPQVLPYALIRSGNSYLIYSRSKGAEERLHGTLSLGFGGHCDMTDFVHEHSNELSDFLLAMLTSFDREMEEELGIDTSKYSVSDFKHAIIDNTNNVGLAHLGVFIEISVDDPSSVIPNTDEIASPVWVDAEYIKQNLHRFENWSQMVAKEFIL